MIWVILVATGGGCGFLVVRWLPRRGKKWKPATWPEIAESGALEAVANKNEMLRMFFLADSINPPDFLANFIEITSAPAHPSHEGASKPTPSAITFDKGANAPPGYPIWFLAAYPDVVVWLGSRDENAMLRVSAEAIYGVEGAKELVRIHGLQRIGELMDEKFEEFDLPQLRRLISIYCTNTKKRLECALIVKEQRPRWWLFESTSKRVSVAT